MIGNRKYLLDVYKAFQVRYMYFQDNLLQILPKEPNNKKHFDYYSNLTVFKMVADGEDLKEHYNQQLSKALSVNYGFIRNWKLMYPFHYLNRIKTLCEKHDIELIFLYIPSFGMAAEKPLNLAEYQKYGRVILPPKNLFNNPGEWADNEHLNFNGSHRFTRWLANELN
ncbi:MAG TPA: hypothetical protein DCX54_01955 [Flavobacteriales bacterium]|nr:hypothetical protein [Flavobacteriales bacterium]